MILVNGVDHKTISDAAKELGVSSKTVRDWIKKGVIEPPPVVLQGLRRIQVFPSDYILRAHAALEAYRSRTS